MGDPNTGEIYEGMLRSDGDVPVAASRETVENDSILSGYCEVDDCSHCTAPWCACLCHDNGGSDLDIDGKTYQEMLDDWKGD